MTKIQWTDAVWNPVTGCTKVSAGCARCYAETIAKRFWKGRDFGDVRCHPERLDWPLRWRGAKQAHEERRPSRIFVNSMSDLFHESVPASFIDSVFAVMAMAHRHTFQVLTKRPERMKAYLERPEAEFRARMKVASTAQTGKWWAPGNEPPWEWPLPNVWLGVSVEDQRTADERIPLLLQTPAAVRFVSYEPALGPVDFTLALNAKNGNGDLVEDEDGAPFMPIDWLIVGGESGPGARPCDVEWIRSAVRQGKAAGVPVFVKQLGAKAQENCCNGQHPDMELEDRKGGDPSEWPEELRVREFPR